MNSLKNKILLLVDDNSNDVFLAKRAFEKNDYVNKIVVAKNGVEALDYLFGSGQYAHSDLNSLPDVILLDLKMSKIDGLEVLKSIRKNVRTKFLPVVILSASKEENDILNCYEAGCNAYLAKPINFDLFTELIKQLGIFWLTMNETPLHSKIFQDSLKLEKGKKSSK